MLNFTFRISVLQFLNLKRTCLFTLRKFEFHRYFYHQEIICLFCFDYFRHFKMHIVHTTAIFKTINSTTPNLCKVIYVKEEHIQQVILVRVKYRHFKLSSVFTYHIYSHRGTDSERQLFAGNAHFQFGILSSMRPFFLNKVSCYRKIKHEEAYNYPLN